MKIYYIDRDITRKDAYLYPFDGIIDGYRGFRECLSAVNELKQLEGDSHRTYRILTNIPYFMRAEYGWNKIRSEYDIFIECKSKAYVNIHKLTDRELKQSTNLFNLYLSGEFDDKINSN